MNKTCSKSAHAAALSLVFTYLILSAPEAHAQQNTLPSHQPNHHRVDFHASSSRHLPTVSGHSGNTTTLSADRVAHNRVWSTFTNEKGVTHSLNRGLDLDLTSNRVIVKLGANLFLENQTITINLDGTTKTLKAGSAVTPSEYLAALQVLGFGSQSLQLDSQGRAVAGTFTLDSINNAGRTVKASELVVPTGVTGVGNFAHSGDFRLVGDLVNSGSIYALSNHSGSDTARINAKDIVNTSSGLISSAVPDAVSAPYGSALTQVNLSLKADKDLSNFGTISSAGNLDLTAGGSISNSKSPNESAPVISASNNVNIHAGSGSIVNGGTINSVAGNVNLGSDADLQIANSGGTIQALAGSINFRDQDYTSTGNINVIGGDLLSKQVNFNSGTGIIEVNADNISGLVNVNAACAHVTASTPDLQLGTLNLSGDPTFFNVGSGNNITLNSDILTNGAALAIVAGGDVTISGPATILDTRGAGNGGNVLIVAGANAIASPPLSGQQGPDTTTTLTLTNGAGIGGGSLSGGSITMNGIQVNTSGSTAASTGGNVQMIAYKGSGASSGTITSALITTSGGASAASGNVSVIAGGDNGTAAITVTGIHTSGGASGTGDILVSATAPTISGGSITILNGVQSGAGQFKSGTITPSTAPVQVNIPVNIDVNNANVTLESPGQINRGTINGTIHNFSETLQSVAFGTINDGAGTLSGSFTLITRGNLGAANITAPGGITLVAGGNISNTTNSSFSTNSATGTSAGDITMVAGAQFTASAGTVVINGPNLSGAGGSILFNQAGFVPLITSKGLANGVAGGNVTMVAFQGTSNTGTMINNGLTITTGGGTGANNGNITIVTNKPADDSQGALGFDFGIQNTSGGNVGTGNITVSNSTPVTPVTIATSNGGITAGTFLGGAISNSTLVFGGTTTVDGATIKIISGSDLFLGTINGGSSTPTVDIFSGNIANLNSTINANSLTVAATFDVVTNNINAAGGITLVAGRAIRNNTAGTISSQSATGDGGNITMIAGADFTDNAGTIVINGPAIGGGGGALLFNQAGNLAAINSQASAGNDGGNITLVAFNGSLPNAGAMIFNGTNISTGAGAGGINGNLTVVSNKGAAGSVVFDFGTIDTTGGTSGTGNIDFENTTPATPVTITKSNGSVPSGSFLGGALGSSAFSVTSTIKMDGAKYTAHTGGDFASGIIGPQSGGNNPNVDLNAGGTAGLSGAITANSLTVAAGADVSTNDINAVGGITLVAGGNIRNNISGTITSQSASGDGGNITLVAGAAFTDNAGTIVINGPSAGGGGLLFNQAGNLVAINSRGSAGNDGGNVTLVAFNGSLPNAGSMIFNGTNISTGAGAGGINGNLTIVSNKGAAGNILFDLGTIDTTGGTSGTGNVDFENTTPVTPVIITKSNGSVPSGSFLGGALGSSAFSVTSIIKVDGAKYTAHIGGDLFTGVIGPQAGGSDPDVDFNVGGTANLNNTITADALTVAAKSDIVIGFNTTASGGIALVAGGNIRNNNVGVISTDSTTADAGNITMVAGADFTVNAGNVVINGANLAGTGGRILFNQAGFLPTITATAGAGHAGGDIALVAFAGTVNDGSILEGATITTHGGAGGANGNFTAVTDTPSTGTFNLSGAINTAGGGINGTGDIVTQNTTPVAPVTITKADGNVPAGSFLNGSISNGDISTGSLTVDGGSINILAGRNVILGALVGVTSAIGNGGDIRVEATGNQTLEIGPGSSGNNRIASISFAGGLTSGNGGDFTAINNGTLGVNIFGNVLVQNNTNGDGGNILINADHGALTFSNGPTVTINASGQGASPHNGGSITLLAKTMNLNGLHVDLVSNHSAGGGNGGSITVVTDSAIDIGSGINQFGLQAQGANSTVTLNSTGSSVNLTVPLTLTNLNLSSTNADITQTATAALNVANVDFTMFGGTPGIADFDNIVNNIGKVSGSGGGGNSGGTIYLDNGANNLSLGDLGSAQSLIAKTTGTMTTAENITAGGDIVLTTANLTNNFSMAANSITVTSQAGSGLTVSGTGGSFNATGAGEMVQLNATNGDLNLFGTQTYVSVTEMNVLAPGSTFRVNAGANIAGQQLLTVNTDLVSLIGIITGNPLVINSTGSGGGTIANSIGDVTLIGDIIFNGNISIIASGNVNAGSATSINLSGPAGGSLTVLAGFDFAPATAGQVNFDTTTTFSGFTANATGGSINLADVDIKTSGSGSAGSVLMIANGGTTNSGSITIGAIDASSVAGNGNNVRLVGEGPISVGDINTSGVNSGAVEVKVASSLKVGNPQVLNGTLSGGTFVSDVVGNGNITTGSINAGRALIDIASNGAASSIAVGNLTGRTIQVSAGTGNLNLTGASAIAATTDATTGDGGTIRLDSNTLTLNNTSTTAVLLTADGVGSGAGGTIVVDTNDQTAFSIGGGTKAKSGHFFSVSAKGGATGDGGTIDISVGGNMSVNGTALQAGPGTGGNGANIKLEAGSTSAKGGSLSVIGNIYASGPSAAIGGKIELISKSTKSFTLGEGTMAPSNGVAGQLTALGVSGGQIIIDNRGGGILVSNGNVTTSNSLELRAGGKGTIANGDSAIITALQDLKLFATTGDIGKKPLMINVPSLTISTTGAVNIDSKRGGLLTLNDSTSKSIKLTTVGGLALNDFTAHDGNICMTANSGTLSVGAGKHIEAINGEICLLNCNALSGNISLGANSEIETSGEGDRVVISIGNPPANPIAVPPPSNVNINEQGSGKVIFATPASGFVIGAVASTINAINKNVILANGSTQSGTQKITFGDNVTITADPPLSASNRSFASTAIQPIPAFTSIETSPEAIAQNNPQINVSTALNQSTLTSLAPQSSDIINNGLATTGLGALGVTGQSLAPTGSVTALTGTVSMPTVQMAISTPLVRGGTSVIHYDDSEIISGLIDADIIAEKNLGITDDVNPSTLDITTLSATKKCVLKSRNAIFAPTTNTIVETPFGNVSVDAKSVVLVMSLPDALAVYDLHDTHRQAVRVTTGNRTLSLVPGTNAVISRAASFDIINPAEQFLYRNLSSIKLEKGLKAFTSEFSVISAIDNVRSLQALATCKHPEAVRLTNQILKTTAVGMHLHGYNDFQYVRRPSTTAWAR